MAINYDLNNTGPEVQDRLDQTQLNEQSIADLQEAVGTGGSVDTRIEAAKEEIIGDASTDYDTLGKVEGKVTTLEDAVGTGGSVDERIATEAAARTSAIENEARAREAADTALGNRMTTLEGSVDDRLDQQDAAIGLLDGHKLEVVDVLPTEQEPAVTPESDVIYRLVVTDAETGDVSYEDYMYNEDDLTTPRKIANYPLPGIDEEPTAGSRKLAESGGIAKVYGSYKDDDNWAYVITDKDSKFIFGIKNDGSIEWSAGVPTPVQDLVNSIVLGTDGVNLDGLNKIETFLGDFSTEDTLKALLDAKVNTEEGKGLIPSQYVEEVDNSEMLQQVLDAAGRVIESTHVDGTKEINWNLKVGGDFETPNRKESTEDSGYVDVLLDANNKLIMGVGHDGDVVFGKVPSQIQNLLDEKEDKGVNPNRKTVRLLLIGNSGSDDAMSYVPFILQNMGIDVNLQIGIAMRSSSTLSVHVQNWENESSVYGLRLYSGDGSWSVGSEGTNGVSLQWIFSNYTWDIVSLQQGTPQVIDSYQPYLNKLVNYIRAYTDYPTKFVWFQTHIRAGESNGGPNRSEETISQYYDSMIEACTEIISETVCEYVVPGGTAIQNARSIISIKELGDYANNPNNTSGYGYLNYSDGVHLQEGLPCQIMAYTWVLSLLDIYGFKEYSINGESTRVTSEWSQGKNIPSPHGSPVGSTDENCYIAQQCAIMAIKHPYEVTDMNYIVNPE